MNEISQSLGMDINKPFSMSTRMLLPRQVRLGEVYIVCSLLLARWPECFCGVGFIFTMACVQLIEMHVVSWRNTGDACVDMSVRQMHEPSGPRQVVVVYLRAYNCCCCCIALSTHCRACGRWFGCCTVYWPVVERSTQRHVIIVMHICMSQRLMAKAMTVEAASAVKIVENVNGH